VERAKKLHPESPVRLSDDVQHWNLESIGSGHLGIEDRSHMYWLRALKAPDGIATVLE
jgi:hypothetical protein